MPDVDPTVSAPAPTPGDPSPNVTCPPCDCDAEFTAFVESLTVDDLTDLPPEAVGIAPAVIVVLAWYLWRKRKKKPPTPPPQG